MTPRFELGNEGFADTCLTTWLCHRMEKGAKSLLLFHLWSGRRGSNSLPRPWQGRALPDELRPQMTPIFQRHGASGRSRTNDTRIFSPLLYQLSYRGISSRYFSLMKGDQEGVRTLDLRRDRPALYSSELTRHIQQPFMVAFLFCNQFGMLW